MSPLQEAINAVMAHQWHGPAAQLAALERLIVEARRVAQPAEPVAGWRMVPADPTDAMVDATHHGQPVADIYRDMIAAAPPAPQPAGRALTDEQIEAGFRDHSWSEVPHPFRGSVGFERGVRFAERAHGIGEGE